MNDRGKKMKKMCTVRYFASREKKFSLYVDEQSRLHKFYKVISFNKIKVSQESRSLSTKNCERLKIAQRSGFPRDREESNYVAFLSFLRFRRDIGCSLSLLPTLSSVYDHSRGSSFRVRESVGQRANINVREDNKDIEEGERERENRGTAISAAHSSFGLVLLYYSLIAECPDK